MIHIDNLCLSFGEKQVLEHFSLTVACDGVTALSGPSGSGKTTLLRCIAGLEHPVSGSVTGVSPKETAILFQENRLLPWRTVEEHLYDVLPPHRAAEAEQLLQLVQLEDERKYYPAQLSGGMARRLAFARCMALGARLYLLDEPFTGIDLPRIRQLMDYLSALPVPVLLSTHEPEVLSMARRIVRLDGPPLHITD